MSTVEQIERAILGLPSDDFQELADWLSELRERRWDEQIAADLAAGRLDEMAANAKQNYREGRFRELY